MPANAKLPLLELGPEKPTMLNLSVANEVIKTTNGVRALEILPGGMAKVTISDEKVTVDFRGGMTLLKDMIVVLNGTAYYTNIYTDGRLEEIV